MQLQMEKNKRTSAQANVRPTMFENLEEGDQRASRYEYCTCMYIQLSKDAFSGVQHIPDHPTVVKSEFFFPIPSYVVPPP